MRLHHFTHEYNLQAILLTGLIRRTDSTADPGPGSLDTISGNSPRELVHLTRDPDPNHQEWCRPAALIGPAKYEPHFAVDSPYDKRRIRMTVSESAVGPYVATMRRLGAPDWWIKAMTSCGGSEHWWVCPSDIPRRKWRLIEDTHSGEVLWRRPMLHEYPGDWHEDAPFLFQLDLSFEEMVEGMDAWYMARFDDGQRDPELVHAINAMTVRHWLDDYQVERTEEEWVEHLRSFDEAEVGSRPSTEEEWVKMLSQPTPPIDYVAAAKTSEGWFG